MKKLLLLSFILAASLFVTPAVTFADIGVSNNTAKIVLDKPLVAGANYDIPSIQVKNTGTEGTDFGVSIEYNQVQSQLRPDAKWVNLSPLTFHLLPGETKIVKASLAIPVSAQPGDYFAYIEAHSVSDSSLGGASIAGAASTKFYFSIAKSSMFLTSYYSLLTYVHTHLLGSYIFLGLLTIGIVYLIVKRVNVIIKHVNSKNLNN